jgi:uncharacterized protein (TIGR04222 family)
VFDTPLAYMPGRDFLLLYVGIMVTFALWGKLYVLGLSRGEGDVPRVPDQPDPYAFAYLRGGQSELVRVLVYAMLQRGDLTEDGGKLVATPGREAALSESELAVYRRLVTPQEPTKLLHDAGLADELKRFTAPLDKQFEDCHFVTPRTHDAGKRLAIALGVVALLGVYKAAAAVAHGRTNIGFTIVFIIIFGFVMKAIMTVPRLTKIGTGYLDQARQAFGSLRSETPDGLLTVGLFGVGVLAGTAFASYAGMYKHAVAAGGNCGGDCSSCSSCSSGGDGGGGGCGGGGCGGCGGG